MKKSINNELDDLARLHAYEHILGSIAMIWSVNHAQANGGLPSEAVNLLKDALKGSMLDSRERPAEFGVLMGEHLDRIMNNVAAMARNADRGFKK